MGIRDPSRPTKIKTQAVKLKCTLCGENKALADYYASKNPFHAATGKSPLCKGCIKSYIKHPQGYIDKDKLFDVLKNIDRAYIHSLWLEAEEVSDDPFGHYLSKLAHNSYGDARWEHSIFEAVDGKGVMTNGRAFAVTDAVRKRWGDGYSPEKYEAFEYKYNTLKNSLPEHSMLYTEAYVNYCKYQVLADFAAAGDNVSAAEKWASLAHRAADAAKITPKSLNGADLNGGLTTFGECARVIEKAKDMISVLPVFREKPRDKIDLAIENIVNHIRKSKGLEPVEHSEIYAFYDKRIKDYKLHGEADDDE